MRMDHKKRKYKYHILELQQFHNSSPSFFETVFHSYINDNDHKSTKATCFNKGYTLKHFNWEQRTTILLTKQDCGIFGISLEMFDGKNHFITLTPECLQLPISENMQSGVYVHWAWSTIYTLILQALSSLECHFVNHISSD